MLELPKCSTGRDFWMAFQNSVVLVNWMSSLTCKRNLFCLWEVMVNYNFLLFCNQVIANIRLIILCLSLSL